MLSRARVWARTLVALATVAVGCAAGAGPAAAATYVVSPSGSDGAAGSAASPFRTISRAAASARGADTVEVRTGRYAETVTLTSRNRGAGFRAAPGATPVIDGGGVREFGFENTGADDVTISGFEITRQTGAGVYSRGARNVIEANTIHHVGAADEEVSNGIRLSRGHESRISGNTIHHIGPGWQSIGIWVLETRDADISANTVYLVRKEGIRDWKGLDNVIARNRSSLNWVGLSLNTSTGSVLTDNLAYDNVEGIVVKHASYRTVLATWALDSGRWSRIARNTVYRSTETSLWLGQSDEPLDYVDVRDNVFAGAGTAFVRDSPELRRANVEVDGNSYSDEGGHPSWVYKAGWGSDPGLENWAEVRSRVGWERAGGVRAARVTAPASVGPDVTWTPFPMTPIDSSSEGTYYTRTHLDKTADNNQSSYWMTATGQNEHVVFDFGVRRTFNHLILTVYGHEDRRNVRGYRFEVSDDGHRWTTVESGTNPDSAGSAYAYELDQPRSGRYLRFTAVDTFCLTYTPRLGCGDSFVVSDLKAGMLADTRAATDDPPAPVAPARPQPPASVGPPATPTVTRPALTPALAIAGRARMTSKRRLRLPVRCTGVTRRLRAPVTLREASGRRRRLVRTTAVVTPGCTALSITLPAAVARRVRAGRLRRARLSTRLPGGRSQTLLVRISR